MSMAVVGLVAGMALGFAGYFGGFGAFVLVAALGAIGFVVGRFLEGDLEPGDFFRLARPRRPAALIRWRRPDGSSPPSAAPPGSPTGSSRRSPRRRPGRRSTRSPRAAPRRTPPSPCTRNAPGYGSASNSATPATSARQCGAVRRQVAERVRALAGMEVPEVAVQIERLHSAHTGAADPGRIR